MGYRLVKGEFHLYYKSKRHVGSQPDGDSIWFKPNRKTLLSNIGGRSAKFNAGGFAQLRFEAIDALELHYEGTEQNHNQAVVARNFTTRRVGFTSVEYSPELYLSVKTATPHPTRGYILTRNVDPYGRPVSFVFAGTTNKQDGIEYWLNTPWLNQSINAALARSGNAYPTFYSGLPTDLRNRILTLTDQARNPRRQIWIRDLSTKGFGAFGLGQLQKLVIWPKLFRRLVTYFKSGKIGLGGFDSWLRQSGKKDDELWIISKGEKGNMHDVIRFHQGKMLMLYPPDDLIIVPQ